MINHLHYLNEIYLNYLNRNQRIRLLVSRKWILLNTETTTM